MSSVNLHSQDISKKSKKILVEEFDFINMKSILKYIILISSTLILGYFIKDAIALVVVALLFIFCLSKNVFRSIELCLIWLFIFDFYVGQDCFSLEIIHKYIAKPSFLILLLFIVFVDRIPKTLFKSNFTIFLVLYCVLTFTSSFINHQSPFALISTIPFFLIFFLLNAKGLTVRNYNSLLNLFVAVGVLQTVVSYFQVSGIIPPPTKLMASADGTKYKWIAGLDDVASGTFGATSSFYTSWYAALISLFLLLMWSITKKRSYLVFTIICFLQFAMVDSKIILFVTALMIAYFLFRLYRKRNIFKINLQKYFFIIVVIIVCSFGFYTAWNSYYTFYGSTNIGNARTSVKSVFETEIFDAKETVFKNIGSWGKINGFYSVFTDFIENDPTQLMFGYGIQGYEYNGKMGYIESKDLGVMQTNNFTNSRSGLITQFATSGLLGMIFLFTSFYIWFKSNKSRFNNIFSTLKNNLLSIYLSFSLIAAFLYTISFNCIPLITFSAIIAIYGTLESKYQLAMNLEASIVEDSKPDRIKNNAFA